MIIDEKILERINGKIINHLSNINPETLFVHTDISKLIIFDFIDKSNYLNLHLKNIKDFSIRSNLWMPTFNYDFTKSLQFDVKKDLSQVGLLNNHFLKQSDWRTKTPVFSFCGTGVIPLKESINIYNPFDFGSEFDKLYKTNSVYSFYGTNISCCTLIHFAEYISKKVNYRYLKQFNGIVISDDVKSNVALNYFVCPLNPRPTYDWLKIKNDLVKNKLLHETFLANKTPYFSYFKVSPTVNFWIEQLYKDPYYFLDSKSKKWVKPLVKKLGRPFKIEDFE